MKWNCPPTMATGVLAGFFLAIGTLHVAKLLQLSLIGPATPPLLSSGISGIFFILAALIILRGGPSARIWGWVWLWIFLVGQLAMGALLWWMEGMDSLKIQLEVACNLVLAVVLVFFARRAWSKDPD